jgi:hypothetical protein
MTLPLVEEKEGFTTAVLRKPDTQKVTPRQAWLILIIFTITSLVKKRGGLASPRGVRLALR